MRTLYYSIFAIALLETSLSLAIQSPALANKASSDRTSFEDYKQECLRRSNQEKLPQDVAQDLCNCTIKKFQSQYTLEEFRALVKKSQNNTVAAENLSAVGEACFEEVLYEE
jgi:hypothetical protein